MGAAVALAGVVTNMAAGSTFSAVAGAAGPGLLSASGGTLTLAGVVHGIASLVKPKVPI